VPLNCIRSVPVIGRPSIRIGDDRWPLNVVARESPSIT
jgi:hypothetical protein